MNDFFEKLKTVGREPRFDPTRKQGIRNQLIQTMHERPVRARMSWWSVRSVQFAAACLIFILAGGITTAYAANQALPGDMLYPVKIHINEPVAGALKKSPQDKAIWEIQKASKRLEEVDQLAINQKLNFATRQTAEQGINHQLEQAQKSIDSIEAAGDAGAATELQSGLTAVLSAHEQVIGSLQNKQRNGNDNGQELEAVKQNVRAVLRRENQLRKRTNELNVNIKEHSSISGQDTEVVSSKAGDTARDSQQKVAAEDMLRRASAALNTVINSSGHNDLLVRGKNLLAAAREAYDSGNYAQALFGAKNVLFMVQETNILEHVNGRLKLDVKLLDDGRLRQDN